MMIRILILFAFVLAPPAWASKTLLVVGDSLSAAYGMPVDQGWVSLLGAKLVETNARYTIVNASISGDTTASARNRLPQLLASHQPHIVIIELGGNDGLRGLAPRAMKDNLAAMIGDSLRGGARVLLVGVQLPPNYGPRYNEQFEAVFQTLAQEREVTLLPSIVDGIGTRPELMQNDGIHPNQQAQPLIARRVFEALQPLLD